MKKVIIVGAGVAGLASAIRLRHAGYDVHLYEKEANPGGKMNQIKKDGFTFDLGPSLVMTPEIYREVFELVGKDPDDYIPMKALDPMFSVFFGEDKDERYPISSDMVKFTKVLESISKKDAVGFFKYLADIYERYNVAVDHFIERPFRNWWDIYNPFMFKQILKLNTLGSAEKSIAKYVDDKRIQQMLSFQTLYIGVSPTNGPSLYTIIPMMELLYGIWFIKGGMYTMAKGMERLFLEMGGNVYYNQNVEEIVIENQRVTGIQTNGTFEAADIVFCNADFPYAMKNLIKNTKTRGKYTDKKINRMKYSCSCFILYLGTEKKYPELDGHNFLMAEDLDENLEQIFNGEYINDPSIYVYAPSILDESMAPEGNEALYVLMPISELSTAQYDWNDETIEHYREKAMKSLKKLPGLENVENEIISETVITPVDFEQKFNAYNGATFGLQPTLLQSNHFRPQAKSKECEGLYFVGSSTHPGAGVPTVLTSAKIAVGELLLDEGRMEEYTLGENSK